MTGNYWLDWAIMTTSLFNTILLVWLGLTVLFNADRRSLGPAAGRWGIWLAGGGLLMGAAFFIIHTAMLGQSLEAITRGMDIGWRLGWFLLVLIPMAWYVLMLWYAGYWQDRQAPLHRRHQFWLALTTAVLLGLAGLLLAAAPLPSFGQVAHLDLTAALSIGRVPLLFVGYPVFIVLCIALALNALRRPGPTGRLMGELARERARPWLVGASLTLLAVSLLVAWALFWITGRSQAPPFYPLTSALARAIGRFDLAIAALIGLAVMLLGRAILAYELFTGRTLPRHGSMRHWRRVLILAAGYGSVIGASLTLHVRAIYGLLLATLLMTLFYALVVWRSYAERERSIEQLRPFVASQRLVERLLDTLPPPTEVSDLFQALCRDVLGAQVAFLIPLGSLAGLISAPLVYPRGRPRPELPPLPALDRPDLVCLPLNPATFGGAHWVVPLWSAGGLAGALLLGDKEHDQLYSQEEMEIARAGGERLLDTMASAELAGRLMALERSRLAGTAEPAELGHSLLGQQARRTLHDDILPQLHAAMLLLSGSLPHDGQTPTGEALAQLAEVHRRLAQLLRELPTTALPDLGRLGLAGALRHLLNSEFADAFDDQSWQVEPAAEQLARELAALTAEVLYNAAREALRNAARHGRRADQPLHISVSLTSRPLSEPGQSEFSILIEDNGAGLTFDRPAAGGAGLALHSTLMTVIGGALGLSDRPGGGVRVTLSLPVRRT